MAPLRSFLRASEGLVREGLTKVDTGVAATFGGIMFSSVGVVVWFAKRWIVHMRSQYFGALYGIDVNDRSELERVKASERRILAWLSASILAIGATLMIVGGVLATVG